MSLEVPTDIPRLIQNDTQLSQISNIPINPGHLQGIFFRAGGHLSLKESKVCLGVSETLS